MLKNANQILSLWLKVAYVSPRTETITNVRNHLIGIIKECVTSCGEGENHKGANGGFVSHI